MNILFITAEFAPIETTGSVRPKKIINELISKGHNVYLVAPDVDTCKLLFPYAKVGCTYTPNNNLRHYQEIRINVNKNYLLSKSKLIQFWFHFILCQDKLHQSWRKDVLNDARIEQLVSQKKIDYVYVNVPLFSIALTALELAKKYKLKLISDFRDHWALWGTSPYISKWHYNKVKSYERKIFEYSTYVFSVTNQVLADFRYNHPNINPKKFRLLPNGHQYSNFNTILTPKIESNGKIILGYVGQFYFNPSSHEAMFTKWYKKRGHHIFQYSPRKESYLYRSPYFIFKHLSIFFEKYPQYKNKIEFHHVGDTHEWMIEMAKQFKVDNQCTFYGRKTFEETKSIAQGFTFGLVTSLKVVEGFGKDYCIASKSFDYMEWGLPVLAFVSEGAQKEMITDVNSGHILDPDNFDYDYFKDLLDSVQKLILNKSNLEKFDFNVNINKLLPELINETLK